MSELVRDRRAASRATTNKSMPQPSSKGVYSRTNLAQPSSSVLFVGIQVPVISLLSSTQYTSASIRETSKRIHSPFAISSVSYSWKRVFVCRSQKKWAFTVCNSDQITTEFWTLKRRKASVSDALSWLRTVRRLPLTHSQCLRCFRDPKFPIHLHLVPRLQALCWGTMT